MNELTISELASFLDRRPNTIRGWCRDGILPEALEPLRDDNGWRYWTQDQAERLKQWIVDEDRRPGKGLVNYKPTPDKIAEHIAKTRAPKNET